MEQANATKAPASRADDPSPDDLREFIKRVSEVAVPGVEKLRRWYDDQSKRAYLLSRGTAATVIVLGASLPLAAALEYPNRDFVVSLVGVVVAALTALGGLFQWTVQWRNFRQAELQIRELQAEWRLAKLEFENRPDSPRVREAILRSARRLVDRTFSVTNQETAEYFETVIQREGAASSSRG